MPMRTSVVIGVGAQLTLGGKMKVPSVLWRCWLGGRKGIRTEKTE